MITISFIIPCYNVERYIPDCIESIYSQKLDESEFEVICVNDCSSDNTHRVIEQLGARHSNLTLLDQPRNMYSGAARNRGLDVAKGEYIWFVDSDDMIAPNSAKWLLEKAYADNLDILYFNYDEISEDGGHLASSRPIFKPTGITTGVEFVTDEFKSRLTRLSLLWCRLLKRELVEKYQIRFSDLYITQDAPFAWETLLRADRVMAVESRAYLYRNNAASITAREPNARRSFTWSFGFPNEVRNVINRLGGVIPASISEGLARNIRYEVNQFPSRFLQLNEKERRFFHQFLITDKSLGKALLKEMNKKTLSVYLFRWAGYHSFCRIVKLLYYSK